MRAQNKPAVSHMVESTSYFVLYSKFFWTNVTSYKPHWTNMILLYIFSSWTWCKSAYFPQMMDLSLNLTWPQRKVTFFFLLWFNYFSTVLSFPPGWVFLVGPRWYLATAALPWQAFRRARNVSALPHQWKPHWEKQKRSDGAQTQTPHSINQVHFGKQSLRPVEQHRHRRREQSASFPTLRRGFQRRRDEIYKDLKSLIQHLRSL